MKNNNLHKTTVLERINSGIGEMRPSEKKVARVIIAEYPVAGLESINELAKRANVSGPTVKRFVDSLGIESYPAFQRLLLGELQERMRSPLSLYETQLSDLEGQDLLVSASDIFVQGIQKTFANQPPSEFNSALELLADAKKRITCVGGRYSNVLAEYMHMHLRQIRPNTFSLNVFDDAQTSFLVDVGKKDVLLVFDFRRYQEETISLVREAVEKGAQVILVTDPYLSPLADESTVVLSTVIAAPSPFDSYVPAFAVIEALIAGLMQSLGETAHKRINKLEKIRLVNSK